MHTGVCMPFCERVSHASPATPLLHPQSPPVITLAALNQQHHPQRPHARRACIVYARWLTADRAGLSRPRHHLSPSDHPCLGLNIAYTLGGGQFCKEEERKRITGKGGTVEWASHHARVSGLEWLLVGSTAVGRRAQAYGTASQPHEGALNEAEQIC